MKTCVWHRDGKLVAGGGGVGEKGLVEEEDDKRLALVCEKQGGGGKGTDAYCFDLGRVHVV